jgi:hypothetical protein
VSIDGIGIERLASETRIKFESGIETEKGNTVQTVILTESATQIVMLTETVSARIGTMATAASTPVLPPVVDVMITAVVVLEKIATVIVIVIVTERPARSLEARHFVQSESVEPQLVC